MTKHSELAAILTIVTLAIGDCLEVVDVDTKYGVIRGQRLVVNGQPVDQFAGVPYARPPVGQLRFAKPVDPLPWSPKILDTTEYKTVYCYEDNLANQPESEDCLYLSIWTPGGAHEGSLLPVYVFLYGGNFARMSGNYDQYNASYAARADVINVFPNSRGTVFGYFHGNRSDAPGNGGLWDQAMVVKWVGENIGAFGGDRHRLTLVGISSGGGAALALALSPVSGPRISGLMVMSGGLLGIAADYAIVQSRKLASALGCDTAANYVACLRRLRPEALLSNATSGVSFVAFQPFQGDDLFPYPIMAALRQGRFNKSVPLLTGGHPLEFEKIPVAECALILYWSPSSGYSINKTSVEMCCREALPSGVASAAVAHYFQSVDDTDGHAVQVTTTKLFSDYIFTCFTYFVARTVAGQRGSGPVFSYYLPYGTEQTVPACANVTWPRPCHDDEKFAMFGQAYREPQLFNDTDRVYTDQMIRLWSTFARTGRPPTMAGYRWPAYQDVPLAPITPTNLGKNETPVWPSYMTITPLEAQRAPVYKPYKDCDTFWSKHMYVYDKPYLAKD